MATILGVFAAAFRNIGLSGMELLSFILGRSRAAAILLGIRQARKGAAGSELCQTQIDLAQLPAQLNLKVAADILAVLPIAANGPSLEVLILNGFNAQGSLISLVEGAQGGIRDPLAQPAQYGFSHCSFPWHSPWGPIHTLQ